MKKVDLIIIFQSCSNLLLKNIHLGLARHVARQLFSLHRTLVESTHSFSHFQLKIPKTRLTKMHLRIAFLYMVLITV